MTKIKMTFDSLTMHLYREFFQLDIKQDASGVHKSTKCLSELTFQMRVINVRQNGKLYLKIIFLSHFNRLKSF